MGSIANVYAKNYVIDYSDGILSSEVLKYFQEEEFFIKTIKWNYEIVESAKAYFQAPLGNLLDRLEITGDTKNGHQFTFDELSVHEADWLEEHSHHYKGPIILGEINEKIDLLRSADMDGFDLAAKHLIDNKIYPYNKEKYKGSDKFCKYLLEGSDSIFDNHPGAYSFAGIIHILGKIYSKRLNIKYDISEFIDYGYYPDSICDAYKNVVDTENHGYRIGEKIIILTEGSSDILILNESLKLLYPHLVDYYYFMDFHTSNASGSTGSLVNTIKSFIGAGINNKVIALFDNDTAAREAIESLNGINVPKNIAILRLPEIELANNYPTIGPSGTSSLNINGLAGSIELYLGKDIIFDNGNFIPIQWKGYSQRIKAYQGEILLKKEVQKKFEKFIKECKQDKNLIHKKDWWGIKLIFEKIFHAFDTDIDKFYGTA